MAGKIHLGPSFEGEMRIAPGVHEAAKSPRSSEVEGFKPY
jgi:hypothetical protein